MQILLEHLRKIVGKCPLASCYFELWESSQLTFHTHIWMICYITNALIVVYHTSTCSLLVYNSHNLLCAYHIPCWSTHFCLEYMNLIGLGLLGWTCHCVSRRIVQQFKDFRYSLTALYCVTVWPSLSEQQCLSSFALSILDSLQCASETGFETDSSWCVSMRIDALWRVYTTDWHTTQKKN